MLILALRPLNRLITLPDHVRGQSLQTGAAVSVGTHEGLVQLREARHGLILRRQLEQAPVDVGEPGQQPAGFEMVTGHGADPRYPVLADVFGVGFAVRLEGEMKASLGGIFVEGSLQQVQGVADLAAELVSAKEESFSGLAHKYAYIYVHFNAPKSHVNRKSTKKS